MSRCSILSQVQHWISGFDLSRGFRLIYDRLSPTFCFSSRLYPVLIDVSVTHWSMDTEYTLRTSTCPLVSNPYSSPLPVVSVRILCS